MFKGVVVVEDVDVIHFLYLYYKLTTKLSKYD